MTVRDADNGGHESVRVRYDGPEQGFALFHHAVTEAGLTVAGSPGPSAGAIAPAVVVRVMMEVTRPRSASGGEATLAQEVRGVIARFTDLYHRAGLDLLET
ncbi:MAG: hypothetical protein ABW122_06910 [Ilumatobacteraceae bacterium]